MKTYYVRWIAADTGERARGAIPGTYPTKVKDAKVKGGQGMLAIPANSIREAFDIFKNRYPNFKDGEGSFFVQISDNTGELEDSTEVASVSVSRRGQVDWDESY